MPETFQGLGVSAGSAAGPAARMAGAPRLPAPREVTDTAAERASATEALAQLAALLEQRSARAAEPLARDVLEAQAMIAADPQLLEDVCALIDAGRDAPHAVHAAFAAHREILASAGGYLAERAADLDDLANRAVAALLGVPMPGLPDPGHPYVLIADDLAPVDTAALDPRLVLALVTERGGPTSHTAILARSLGLPAVVGCPQTADIPDGALVHVDGDSGVVRVGVSGAQAAAVRVRAQADREALSASSGPGRTADDRAVPLLLNIGSAADLGSQGTDAHEGVGLLRTELAFLSRTQAPSLAEQREAYAAVFRALPGRKVVVRTLDAGADKPLPFLDLGEQPNPALGVRGLRTARRRADLLDLQLEAVALAAAETEAQVWVMAPMVSVAREAEDFARRARGHGLACVGVMVEVPAAALRARRLLEGVDFLSIGTNDLGQYTMAADRQCGELADLLDPWQPALLELIALCGRAGAETGKPVGVCGEAAADPLMAAVLVGLGISTLSMSARAVPAVRARLARHTFDACVDAAGLALKAPDAREARAAVAAWAERDSAGG